MKISDFMPRTQPGDRKSKIPRDRTGYRALAGATLPRSGTDGRNGNEKAYQASVIQEAAG
jgi:hypothetical protein